LIIKPVRRGGFTSMGRYILDLGANDKTEVLRIVNLPLAGDVWEAMAQMRAMLGDKAHGKNAVKTPFEHIVFRPRDGERLTREQFDQMKAETLRRLGYESCPRVEWEDVLNGETHQHVAVLRLDADGQPIKPYLPVRICKQVAEEFEVKFGLTPALKDSPKAPYYDAKDEIAKLWEQTKDKTGAETKVAFEEHGFTLARGDRGQFILISKSGAPYNPTRIPKLKQAKLHEAGVRKRFKGIKIETLPTVKEVQSALGVQPKPSIKKVGPKRNKPRAENRKGQRKKFEAKKQKQTETQQEATEIFQPHVSKASGLPLAVILALLAARKKKKPTRKLSPPVDRSKWPVEAVTDWIAWGQFNPKLFFDIWSKLRPDIFQELGL
jgi:hypothetical protein